MSTAVRFGIAGLLVLGLVGIAPTAMAANQVVKQGTCTGNSKATLTLGLDNGRIEVQYEVDSNHAGQTWRVRLRHDGVLFFSGTRMTQAPGGSFEVRKFVKNRAGTDVFRARARNLSNGEVCTATASI
jgi:hypothetical protein